MSCFNHFGTALAVLVLAGCAASPAVQNNQPIHDGDTVGVQAEALREEQFRVLYEFDGALTAGLERCPGLCQHHTAICGLSTRICAIAKAHPEHVRVQQLCEQGSETCRETSLRLPADCFCQ